MASFEIFKLYMMAKIKEKEDTFIEVGIF